MDKQKCYSWESKEFLHQQYLSRSLSTVQLFFCFFFWGFWVYEVPDEGNKSRGSRRRKQQLHYLICFSSAVVQIVCPLDNEQPVIKANIIKALVGSTNMPWTQNLHQRVHRSSADDGEPLGEQRSLLHAGISPHYWQNNKLFSTVRDRDLKKQSCEGSRTERMSNAETF